MFEGQSQEKILRIAGVQAESWTWDLTFV